jgi:hypothetical protein
MLIFDRPGKTAARCHHRLWTIMASADIRVLLLRDQSRPMETRLVSGDSPHLFAAAFEPNLILL